MDEVTPEEYEKSHLVTLDNFIQMMNDIRLLEMPHQAKTILTDFYALLSKKRFSVTTGSSVLYKRIGKDEGVRDIDIFINCENYFKENREQYFREFHPLQIIKEFFGSSMLREKFCSLNPANNCKDNKSYLFSFYPTSSEDYAFVTGNTILNTFKGHIGENVTLNFIFVSKITSALERQNSNPDPNLREIIRLSDWPTSETFHISFMESNFDFEELKFIYDWQDDTIKSVYMVKKEIYLVGEELRNIHPAKEQMQVGPFTYKNLESLDEEFLSLYSINHDTLTISLSRFPFRRLDYLSKYLKEDNSGSVLEDSSFMDTAKDLYHLAQSATRIHKYTQRGFKIVDQRPVIGSILNNINLIQQALYNDKIVEEMMRGSIFTAKSKRGLLNIQKHNKLKKFYNELDLEQDS